MPSRRDLANAIRALAMDAVQKANSGHPGAPMGMADIAEVLWNDFMSHNPANPHWPDRDRFIMSNGHGSMLPYSLLHLTGYDLPLDELKQFRQLHSKTDGCLMEGISHEACSLAGTLGLGKLVCFYDDNGISIDGEVEGWFTDDTPKRFEAYGWHVVRGVDGHDAEAIKAAIEEARSVADKPTLICCRTIIGFGSPNKQGKEECHGAALGEDEVALTRKELGWKYGPFEIPDEIYAGWNAREKGAADEADWNAKFDAYRAAHPELADELQRRLNNELVADFDARADAFIQSVVEKGETIASRKASQNAIKGFAAFTDFMGGSADLAGSNLTLWPEARPMRASSPDANYINYGVREFGMTAIINGIALHGGFVPYGATFLMFSEYARNALRMAALIKARNIEVFTHDSVGLGEDGPTHQPVEQTATLRLMPNMSVWRPCDAVETAIAWKMAIKRMDGPTSLILSRQNLAHQTRSDEQLAAVAKGGYVLKDCDGTPEAIIIATGSEVGLAMEAAAALGDRKIRVVSMPSTDAFDAQDEAYKESVLPRAVRARVAVEAGVTDGWRKYVGLEGAVVGLDRFGESAPGGELFKYFGFTVEHVVETVKAVL
ncbi:MAG: transketolase [Acidihalobacter sp.]